MATVPPRSVARLPISGPRVTPAVTPARSRLPAFSALTTEHEQVRRLTCGTIRQQAEDLALLPPTMRVALWCWLSALALEATDRAEHGCAVCGALIARPDGACQAVIA